MDIQLPPIMGRLRLPVINTENKRRAQSEHQSDLEQFIAEQCNMTPGAMILFSEFCDRFHKWLSDELGSDALSAWVSKKKIIAGIPQQVPYGIQHSNRRYIGNIAWSDEPQKASTPWIVVDGKLKTQGTK